MYPKFVSQFVSPFAASKLLKSPLLSPHRTLRFRYDEIVQAVDARDLHAELGGGKDFSTWMKDQIKRAMLVDGVDYEVFTEKGGRSTASYLLSLDAAKNI